MNKLIVFEGIDGSYKTTTAKAVAEAIGYKYFHEPNFSSEEADCLNFVKGNAWCREFYFMKDRINNQAFIKANNVCLDRYIPTGLAYCRTFGIEALPMVENIYFIESEFKKPNIIIKMNIAPQLAYNINEQRKGTPEYNPKQKLNTLLLLDDNLNYALDLCSKKWNIPIITIEPIIGKPSETCKKVVDILYNYI